MKKFTFSTRRVDRTDRQAGGGGVGTSIGVKYYLACVVDVHRDQLLLPLHRSLWRWLVVEGKILICFLPSVGLGWVDETNGLKSPSLSHEGKREIERVVPL